MLEAVVMRHCWVRRRGKCCRSEEHTSELQSQSNLVCRLLLEKKKSKTCLTATILKSPTRQAKPASFPANITATNHTYYPALSIRTSPSLQHVLLAPPADTLLT